MLWYRFGGIVAVPWFAAILIGEAMVRGLPEKLPVTLVLSAVLTASYGIVAEALRRSLAGELLKDRRHLLSWLAIVVAGTLATSALYVSLLYLSGLIPAID